MQVKITKLNKSLLKNTSRWLGLGIKFMWIFFDSKQKSVEHAKERGITVKIKKINSFHGKLLKWCATSPVACISLENSLFPLSF